MKAHLRLLINKVHRLAKEKTLIPSLPTFSAASSSSSKSHLGFFLSSECSFPMADAGDVNLGTGALMEKRGRGRPRGSKNKPKDASLVPSSSASVKRRPGHPVGSKNKPKVSTAAAPGSSAAPRNASPPAPVNTFSFFCITSAQCREIQRVPLKFTKFIDGHELREAILHEQSGEGTPYEVEVYYDGRGEMYF
jgi:hypothetical protein